MYIRLIMGTFVELIKDIIEVFTYKMSLEKVMEYSQVMIFLIYFPRDIVRTGKLGGRI